MDWAEIPTRRDEKQLSLGIMCDFYQMFDGNPAQMYR